MNKYFALSSTYFSCKNTCKYDIINQMLNLFTFQLFPVSSGSHSRVIKTLTRALQEVSTPIREYLQMCSLD